MRALENISAAFAILMSFVLIFLFLVAFALLTIALVVPHVLYRKALRRPSIITDAMTLHRHAYNSIIALFFCKDRRFGYEEDERSATS